MTTVPQPAVVDAFSGTGLVSAFIGEDSLTHSGGEHVVAYVYLSE